jgi:hypothetical protein
MATIRATLKQLAADTLPDYTYLFEDWDTADTKLEKLSYPAIVCIIPASGTTEIRNGRVYDTVNVALAYLDTVPRGAEGDDNGECIDRMKMAGARMIRAINQSHQFEQLEGQQYYETIIERLSTIVSGVMYSLQLTQSIGGCEV